MDYNQNRTYYNILGVEKDASLDSIQKAKDRLKYGGPDDRVPFNMWAKIDEAYSVLSNSEKRKEYDKKLEYQKNNTYLNINEQSPFKFSVNKIEDIYSNTNKQSSSIFNDEIENNNSLKGIGNNILLALPTAILSTITIIKTIGNKIALIKDKKEKNINEIKTYDSQLIEEYRIKLENKIDLLLQEPHNNYKLEIQRLKYENNINLLRAQINHMVSQNNNSLKYKIELNALKIQLSSYEKKLIEIDKKLDSYSGTNRLKKIQEELINVNRQLSMHEKFSDKREIIIKQLQIRKKVLSKLKKFKIEKLKFNSEIVAIFKDSIMNSHSLTKSTFDTLFK